MCKHAQYNIVLCVNEAAKDSFDKPRIKNSELTLCMNAMPDKIGSAVHVSIRFSLYLATHALAVLNFQH